MKRLASSPRGEPRRGWRFGTAPRRSKDSAWVDVSVPIRTGMVHWPDNPPVRIERTMDMTRGDVANVSHLSFGAHTGTHMDAPLHFLKTGDSMDRLPFDAVIGPVRVIAISDAERVSAAAVRRARVKPGERILFKTRNSARCWRTTRFIKDFVYVAADAAAELVRAGVRTIGVDYLSVGGYARDGVETHRILLEAGVWIIEGLDLSSVSGGAYDMVCLPLRMQGAEGAPARVILRKG